MSVLAKKRNTVSQSRCPTMEGLYERHQEQQKTQQQANNRLLTKTGVIDASEEGGVEHCQLCVQHVCVDL